MMKTLKIIGATLALMVAAVAVFIYQSRYTHPDLKPFAPVFLPVDDRGPTATPGAGIHVKFLGVTTLLISDGQTSLLTDGYFTRIGLFDFLLRDVEPDRKMIRASMKRAGITDLAAVMVVHAHFDHSMDAPIVAELSGARLLGSESTANVGRGLNFPEDRIQVVESRRPIAMGKFKVTFIENKHTRLPDWLDERISAGQKITEPLVPPTSAFDYKEGLSYSILIEHPAGDLLIHSSAGFLPGALKGLRADTILLGIGGAGEFERSHFQEYLKETVHAVGARRVIPIHWDDIFRPADAPILPAGDFPAAMKYLEEESANAERFEIRLLPDGRWARLF